MTEKDLEFIKSWETFVDHWYDAGDGLKTGGWGHVQLFGEGFITHISDEQGSKWLMKDIEIVEHAVAKLVHIATTHNQYLALCSIIFNCGVARFTKSDTRRVVNTGNIPAIVERWKTAFITSTVDGVVLQMDGLKARREAEAKLWLS